MLAYKIHNSGQYFHEFLYILVKICLNPIFLLALDSPGPGRKQLPVTR
jgi:hypothetical protein